MSIEEPEEWQTTLAGIGGIIGAIITIYKNHPQDFLDFFVSGFGGLLIGALIGLMLSYFIMFIPVIIFAGILYIIYLYPAHAVITIITIIFIIFLYFGVESYFSDKPEKKPVPHKPEPESNSIENIREPSNFPSSFPTLQPIKMTDKPSSNHDKDGLKAIQPKQHLKVFICYASDDVDMVKDLYKRLNEESNPPIEAWLDKENILPGQKWTEVITDAVQKAHVVVACLSPTSINKEGFVNREIKLALDVADEKPEGTIFLIPARLKECDVPRRLSNWQWVNLYENDGYQRLTLALRTRAKSLNLDL